MFDLTPAQIFARCQEKGRCQICAGEALTLRDLMQWFGWSIAELAECSQVSRAMISAILRALKFPTVDIIARLAACFGLELHEFDLMAEFVVKEEVPL
ncbi:MAG: helix-turn-helix transcriptional regulator [Prosthecobacter sp.]